MIRKRTALLIGVVLTGILVIAWLKTNTGLMDVTRSFPIKSKTDKLNDTIFLSNIALLGAKPPNETERLYAVDLAGAGGIGYFLAKMSTIVPQGSFNTSYREAYQWLCAVAEPAGQGYKWPKEQGGTVYYTDFGHGAAGIGRSFLEAYMVSGNETYLYYAEGAATWLMSIAIPVGDGYKWTQTEGGSNVKLGYTHGVAGIGDFFLRVYNVTGDNIYKEYAVGAAEWLKSMAVETNGGYKWLKVETGERYETGWCVGAAGIAEFFYLMYKELNDTTYKDYASGALNWLKSIAVAEAGGYKWSPYEGAGDYPISLGKGAAGIGNTFLLGYVITGNTTYLEYAEGAATWVNARIDAGGLRNTGICAGHSGTSLFFINMYKITGDELYEQCGKKIGDWLNSTKVKSRDGYTWPLNPYAAFSSQRYLTGFGWGVAGVGHVLWQLGTAFSNSTFLEMAKEAADWLIVYKVPEYGGSKWPKEVLLADLNDDGIVDIVDVVIVALAFGSVPGDPDWNLDADLNVDDLIDIVDVVMVAVNFGRTA